MKKILVVLIIILCATLFSACNRDIRKIKFETNGGSPIETIKTSGTIDIRKMITTKDFYVFDGWFIDKECTISFDDYSYKRDVTAYAKWRPMFELMPDDTYCLINGYLIGYDSFTIPKEYNGKPVNSIAPRAFQYSLLKKVVIPNTIKMIENAAFIQCINLKEIEFEEGIKIEKFGEAVFASCTSLESIVLPEILSEVAYETILSGCKSLKSITFSGKVQTTKKFTIENNFKNSPNIEEINIPESMWEFDFNFTNTAWYKAQPDGVVYIGDIAYRYKGKTTSITVAEGTKYIGARFLQDQTDIVEVVLPSTIIGIGFRAFNIKSLRTINLPDGLKYIGDNVFDPFSFLKNSINHIPNSLEHIGESAFISFDLIKELPTSLISVGRYAFGKCKGITTIPDTLQYVEDFAFLGAVNISKIPTNLVKIGTKAFDDTAWFNQQENGLLYYGNVAFSFKGDHNLITRLEIRNGTKIITKYLLSDFKKVTTIILPNSLEIIEEGAFAGSQISSITLPNSLLEIGNYAFSSCLQLKSIVIPSSVVSIGAKAFYNSYKLNNVTLNEGLKVIGDNAFSKTQLDSLFIPKSVVNLGNYVFDNNLSSLRLGFSYYPTLWARNNYLDLLKNNKISYNARN